MAILKRTIIGYDGSTEMGDDFILRVGPSSDEKLIHIFDNKNTNEKLFQLYSHSYKADVNLTGLINLTFKKTLNDDETNEEKLDYMTLKFLKDMLCGDGTFGLKYVVKTDSSGEVYAECIGYDPNFIKIKSSEITYSKMRSLTSSEGEIKIANFVSGNVPVKSIGEKAFKDCDKLLKVIAPTTMQYIDSQAFYNCISLSKFSVVDSCADGTFDFSGMSINEIGVNAFYKNNFTNLIIPSSTKKISDYAFSSPCKTVEKVTIQPNSSLTIKSTVFQSAKILEADIPGSAIIAIMNDNLTKLRINSGEIANDAFVTNSTTNPKTYFYNKELELTLASAVKKIGSNAFGCEYKLANDTTFRIAATKIKKINYEGTTANDWAKINFGNSYANPLCYDTSELYINGTKPVEITLTTDTISSDAFYNCDQLTKVTISSKIIGDRSFQRCENLTSINLQDGVESIGTRAFGSCGLKKDSNKNVIVRTNFTVTIPKTVTKIYGYAFQQARITTLTIANGGSSLEIDSYAFERTGLSEITIPSHVDKVDTYAFANCIKYTGTSNNSKATLSKIVFEERGDRDINIYSNAFYNTGITSLTIPVLGDDDGYSENGGASVIIKFINSFKIEENNTRIFKNTLTDLTITGTGDIYSKDTNRVPGEGVYSYQVFGGEEANGFKRCIKLENITIGENIQHIPAYIFSDCHSVKYIKLPFLGLYNPNNERIDMLFFDESWYESGYVDNGISSYFYNNNSINYKPEMSYSFTLAILFNSELDESSPDMFVNSYSITPYITSNNIDEEVSFRIPNSLETVEILNGNIYFGAFSGYSSIRNITIPTNEENIRIHRYAFCNCEKLVNLNNTDKTKNVINIPGNFVSIGSHAFEDCYNITNLVVNNNFIKSDLPTPKQSVGEYAFNRCTGLINVTIGDGIRQISNGAFYNCSKLTTVKIGSGIRQLGNANKQNEGDNFDSSSEINGCFENCINLQNFTFSNADNLEGIYINSFNNCGNLNAYITLTPPGGYCWLERVITELIMADGDDSAFYSSDDTYYYIKNNFYLNSFKTTTTVDSHDYSTENVYNYIKKMRI